MQYSILKYAPMHSKRRTDIIRHSEIMLHYITQTFYAVVYVLYHSMAVYMAEHLCSYVREFIYLVFHIFISVSYFSSFHSFQFCLMFIYDNSSFQSTPLFAFIFGINVEEPMNSTDCYTSKHRNRFFACFSSSISSGINIINIIIIISFLLSLFFSSSWTERRNPPISVCISMLQIEEEKKEMKYSQMK